MTIYIIGSNGRLGQAIKNEFSDCPLVSLNRSVYESWAYPDKLEDVANFFEGADADESTVFVASGLLDPSLSYDDLANVNYHLPKNIIEASTRLGIKVMTFGSVMENLSQAPNPYVQSKIALRDFVDEATHKNAQVTHVQVHTLYGLGMPSPHMFLGQILTSLLKNEVFSMTSGNQLREYHHLAEEAMAIRAIHKSKISGTVNLSYGNPVSLKSIAQQVFESFGKTELLQIGALGAPPEENYSKVLTPIECIKNISLCDPLEGIVSYLHQCVIDKRDAGAPKG